MDRFIIDISSRRWNRTNMKPLVQSGSPTDATDPHHCCHRDTAVSLQVRGGGVEPPLPGSKPGGLPLADPRSRSSALRESNPPRQLGRLRPADRPSTERKVRESNPQGSSLDRFRTAAIAIGLTFRFKAPAAGLEPAVGQTPRRLNRPIPATNSGTPDHKVRMAGFEPAISCSRSRRNTRLSYILN